MPTVDPTTVESSQVASTTTTRQAELCGRLHATSDLAPVSGKQTLPGKSALPEPAMPDLSGQKKTSG